MSQVNFEKTINLKFTNQQDKNNIEIGTFSYVDDEYSIFINYEYPRENLPNVKYNFMYNRAIKSTYFGISSCECGPEIDTWSEPCSHYYMGLTSKITKLKEDQNSIIIKIEHVCQDFTLNFNLELNFVKI